MVALLDMVALQDWTYWMDHLSSKAIIWYNITQGISKAEYNLDSKSSLDVNENTVYLYDTFFEISILSTLEAFFGKCCCKFGARGPKLV